MPPVPLHHLRMRVSKAIIAPPRYQHPTRRRGTHEPLAGGTAAAMVRRLQPVNAWRVGRRQPGTLRPCLHVAGQQQPLTLRLDQQHTGAVITAATIRPAPQRKTHAIPFPLLATGTGLQLNIIQRFPTDNPLDRQTPLYRPSTAGMIGVGMADQHHVQVTHPQLAQGRQHHPLPQVAVAPRRPGVIQQVVMPSAQQHRQALANVQLPDLHLPERHRLARHPEGQQHHPAQPSQRHATGQQHQQSPQADQQPGP
ncbi:hypothetical protein PSNVIR_05168 [Pseudomonas sp. Nvir]|nr:hypothetical protein PSNVIR_05168 [Pseudomonas sp. Nvir]